MKGVVSCPLVRDRLEAPLPQRKKASRRQRETDTPHQRPAKGIMAHPLATEGRRGPVGPWGFGQMIGRYRRRRSYGGSKW